MTEETLRNQLEAFVMKLEKDVAQGNINESDLDFLKRLADRALEKL